LISADNPHINYYGRFDMSDPSNPVFNWSGTVIEANFPGPTIGMKMSHNNAWYDIEIDGQIDTVINCGSDQNHIFRTGLSTSLHTLRIILRSEDHYSKATFGGLYLADGKTLGPAPAKPTRKIEFLGDSHSAGYGVESSDRTCDPQSLHRFTNANKAFPMLITRELHAQSIILGCSGKGVVKNYSDPNARSDKPYSYYYQTVLGEASNQKWDFTQWIPDLVVICLGTNDFSTYPHPEESVFLENYHLLIEQIITNYPSAKISCISTTDDKVKRLVKQVVDRENNTFNHPQVFEAAYPPYVEYTGCDWHPSIADNIAIARGITDTIMKKLSWNTATTNVTFAANGKRNHQPPKIAVKSNGSSISFIISSTDLKHNTVYLTSTNGKRLAQTIPDIKGEGEFPIRSLPKGMYIIGNKNLGWTMVTAYPTVRK
jgi:lysophospholipase L1-like esterase